MTSTSNEVAWQLSNSPVPGWCREVEPLVSCLEKIPDVGGMRDIMVQDVLGSVSSLINMCLHWYDSHQTGEKFENISLFKDGS